MSETKVGKMQELIRQYQQEPNQASFLEIIREIQQAARLWVAVSPLTKDIFVDYVKGSATAFLFSEKEYGQAYCQHIREQGFVAELKGCSEKERLDMFGAMHRSGFESLIIDNGKSFMFIELTDLINLPDFSNIPEKDRPVFNPSLVCSVNRFLQCMQAKKNSPDKELNVLIDLSKARFLLPVQGSPKDGRISIPSLERSSDERKFIPLFTDITELRKFDTKQEFKTMVGDFTQLEAICRGGETVVINPMGFNFIVDAKTCDAVQRAVQEIPPENSQKKVVFYPADLSKELINGLTEILEKNDKAVMGFVKGMRVDRKSRVIVGIDCGEGSEQEIKAILDDIQAQAEKLEGGKSLEFIYARSGLGRLASKDVTPFYELVDLDFSDDDVEADIITNV